VRVQSIRRGNLGRVRARRYRARRRRVARQKAKKLKARADAATAIQALHRGSACRARLAARLLSEPRDEGALTPRAVSRQKRRMEAEQRAAARRAEEETVRRQEAAARLSVNALLDRRVERNRAEAEAEGFCPWVECWDPASSAFYYYNHWSHETTWEKPEAYRMAADDETFRVVLKMQLMWRGLRARRRARALRRRLAGLRRHVARAGARNVGRLERLSVYEFALPLAPPPPDAKAQDAKAGQGGGEKDLTFAAGPAKPAVVVGWDVTKHALDSVRERVEASRAALRTAELSLEHNFSSKHAAASALRARVGEAMRAARLCLDELQRTRFRDAQETREQIERFAMKREEDFQREQALLLLQKPKMGLIFGKMQHMRLGAAMAKWKLNLSDERAVDDCKRRWAAGWAQRDPDLSFMKAVITRMLHNKTMQALEKWKWYAEFKEQIEAAERRKEFETDELKFATAFPHAARLLNIAKLMKVTEEPSAHKIFI
jgi:hypothetical protein